MMVETDANVEIARLQKEIKNALGLKSDNLFFDYKEVGQTIDLHLITVNPRHNQSFLYHQERGVDKLDALKKMWVYVLDHKKNENSYTIQWIATGDSELHTSYFRANNVYEALDKLYYGRDMNTINIYSVVLNPVS